MARALAGSDTRTVPDAFRRVVAEHGNRAALESDRARLTYAELDRLSNAVAHGLLQQGHQPVAMVTALEPSSIVAMLGALKAGRIFAPLDPRDPPERAQLVLDRLGPHLLLTATNLPTGRDDDPKVAVDPEHPALVYFTSGSTGHPRGVIKGHEHLTEPTAAHGLVSDDRFGVILPLAFAGSMVAVFGPLLAGSTICLFDPVTRGIGALAEWIDHAGITVFQTSPSVLRAIAVELETRGRTARAVRLVIVGGEPCSGRQLEVARRVLPEATITNHYGSTEGGGIACTRIPPGVPLDAGPILFRHIYPEQVIEIVDDDGQLVAPGEAGEIRVSSSRVALGYWGDDPEAAERPFVAEGAGVRSIRLGDRARLHPDGTLELLGRGDLRVKIHGQTADPQAIERALEELPGVQEAIVSPIAGRDGETRLVAHVATSRRASSTRAIRLALSAKLPPFLIPSTFVRVAAIPRNERGKADRDLLRQTAADAAPEGPKFVPPRDAHEGVLAQLIAEALGLDRVGVHDDIFDLGADSLSIIGLSVAISERLGAAVGTIDLLEAPTIEALAKRIGDRQRSVRRVVFPLSLDGSGAPIFYLPGGGGVGMLAIRRLGRRLGRPAFSFVARGFESLALPDQSVERCAGRFVDALRTVQPSGPYLIAGLSFGGLMAFEVAQQLEAAGDEVALLVLIDPVSLPPAGLSTHLANAWTDLTGPRAARMGPVRRLARRVRKWAIDRYRVRTAGLIPRPPPKQMDAFFRLNVQMARRYQMKPYDGRCLLLRTGEWQTADRVDYSRVLTGETRERLIPGTHFSMVGEPHLAALSGMLRDELARAMAGRDDSPR